MIKALMVYNIKENKVIIIGFTLVIMIYTSLSVAMYDPVSLDGFDAIMDLLPEALVSMFGFGDLSGSMARYLSNYLYGFILILFPILFTILLGSRLISRHVDKGSMIYLITMPYTRKKIVTNQAIFFILSLLFIFIVNIIVILVMSAIMFPGLLDYGLFLMVNLVAISVHLLLTAIVFLASVIFDDVSKCLGISGSILMLFMVFTMVSTLGDGVAFLRYLTPFSLINVDYILEGGGNGLLTTVIVLLLTAGVYAASIQIFNKKSIIV